MLFGIGIALGLCEAALRLLWHNPYATEMSDEILKIRLHHPNTHHFIDRSMINPDHPTVVLRTDARSYILPSFQHSNPDVTIAFLGGSTTECIIVQEELRFHARVSTMLGEQGLRVNTLNAARSGNTTHDALNIFFNHVLNDRPDIVVMMHATNDLGVLNAVGNYLGRTGKPVSIPELGKWVFQKASGRSYVAGIVRQATTSGVQQPGDPRRNTWRNDPSHPELASDPFERRLKAFVHMARDFGVEPVLMTQPLSTSTNELTPGWYDLGAQGRFNAIIRRIGKEEGVLVIDLVRHLAEDVPDWNKPMNLFYDGMHVTDAGSEVFARHIADRLLPLIQSRRRADR